MKKKMKNGIIGFITALAMLAPSMALPVTAEDSTAAEHEAWIAEEEARRAGTSGVRRTRPDASAHAVGRRAVAYGVGVQRDRVYIERGGASGDRRSHRGIL